MIVWQLELSSFPKVTKPLSAPRHIDAIEILFGCVGAGKWDAGHVGDSGLLSRLIIAHIVLLKQ